MQLQALQDVGKITQMTSASYKKIEVEEASWMLASRNEAKIFLTDDIKGYVLCKWRGITIRYFFLLLLNCFDRPYLGLV